MDYLLKAVFAGYKLVLVAATVNVFPYLLDKFLANDKNQCPLTYFLVLGSVEYLISIY